MAEDHYLKTELYERLRTDSKLFEFLESGSLDGVWFWDIEEPENEWLSPRFKELFGYADHEMEHSPDWWQENIHPDDLEKVLENFERHKEDPNHPYDQVVRYRHQDGSHVWVRCRGLIIRDDDGKPVRMLGAHTDVTELKRIEAEHTVRMDELMRQHRQMEALVELGEFLHSCAYEDDVKRVVRSKLPVMFRGWSGTLMLCNPSGRTADNVASWGTLETSPVHEIDDCWAIRRGRTHVQDGADDLHCSHLDEAGGPSVCMVLLAHGTTVGVLTVCGEGVTAQQPIVAAVADQIALSLANIRLRESLRQQSIRDPITGLFNRRYLEDTLLREATRAIRTETPLSALMLDLDHFKGFNDEYGHVTADRMLEQFARLLQDSFRTSDIVCRYGGEEFTVVMPGSDLDEAVARAEEICEATRSIQMTVGGKVCRPVTVSVGAAALPRHTTEASKLIRIADAALYQAKACGRDQVCVPEVSVEADPRLVARIG